MSYDRGWAALHLEMPDRVPRTEYSADSHWALVSRVTGIPVDEHSDPALQKQASAAFRKAWDYAYIWNVQTYNQIFDGKYTKMGHAVYAAGGVDYSNQITELFDDPDDALDLDFDAFYGRRDHKELVRAYNEHYRAQGGEDLVTMTGIYVTLISGLLEVLGWNMLLEAATERERFGGLVRRYAAWIGQYFRALADCESPVIMVHDDIVWTSGAFMHPDFYRKYIFPCYRELFRPLQEAGKTILYTSDGNYTEFVDDIAGCGVSGFVMEPCTDMGCIAEKYGRTHSFTGNFDTRILLTGSREDIDAEMRRCMDIGKKYPGFILAVGNHIPSNTPVENALWYNELYEKYARR